MTRRYSNKKAPFYYLVQAVQLHDWASTHEEPKEFAEAKHFNKPIFLSIGYYGVRNMMRNEQPISPGTTLRTTQCRCPDKRSTIQAILLN